MNAQPCERIDDLNEIKRDIKELLAFKNRALGIIMSLTIICNVLVFLLTKL